MTSHDERLSLGKEESMTGNHLWDHAWKMVVDRTPMAEAMFVYAVRTTGIYCRPSCPSRRPLRASVEFYPTSELAEQSGISRLQALHSGAGTSAASHIDRGLQLS